MTVFVQIVQKYFIDGDINNVGIKTKSNILSKNSTLLKLINFLLDMFEAVL
jgi:hypothetical protein